MPGGHEGTRSAEHGRVADLTSVNTTEVHYMTAVALAPASAAPNGRRTANGRPDVREAERRLLVRYHRDSDLAAREQLVKSFLPFARELAMRYRYTDEPVDDLLQVANLGLIKAIDR